MSIMSQLKHNVLSEPIGSVHQVVRSVADSDFKAGDAAKIEMSALDQLKTALEAVSEIEAPDEEVSLLQKVNS